MNGTIEQLRRLRQKDVDEAAKLEREWEAFAIAFATNQHGLKPAQVFAKLNEFGRTIEDLQAVDEAIKRRSELADDLAGAEQAQVDSAAAMRELEEEDNRFQAEKDRHQERRNAISARMNVASLRQDRANTARRRLLESCGRPIREELTSLNAKLSELRREAELFQLVVDRNNQRPLESLTEADRIDTDEALKALEGIRPQIEELKGRIADTQSEALKPASVSVAEIVAAL